MVVDSSVLRFYPQNKRAEKEESWKWLIATLVFLFLFCSSCWTDKMRSPGEAGLGTAAILEFQPEQDKDDSVASAITIWR